MRKIRLAVRVSPEMKESVRYLSKKRGVSMSSYVREQIKRDMATWKKEKARKK